MTVLQDWLSIRPVDQRALVNLVCRPFRAVLASGSTPDTHQFTLQRPGIERC